MSETGPSSDEIDEGALARPATTHTRVPISIERSVAAAAMAVICLISFSNVVVRYVTDYSFAFTEEFSVFLLVIMTFAGASLAFATDENIRITFILKRLPPEMRKIAETLALLASFLMFALVFYYSAELSWDEFIFEETSPGLGYPNWIYTVWLPILSLAIMGRVTGRLIALFRGRL